MRIISAGNVHVNYGAEALLNRALKRAGHEVIEVFYPTRKEDYSIFNETLKDQIKGTRPELVIVGKVPGLTYDKIIELKNECGIPIVQMTYDLMRKLGVDDRPSWWYPQIKAGGFDWVFGASDNKQDKENINKYTDRYSCLREGVDSILHKPILTQFEENKEKYQADVAFTGAPYNEFRREMMLLFNHEKRFEFRHYGNLFLGDLANMASVTKLSIGTNFYDDIQGYWSARMFENMGVGLTFLTPYIKGMRKEGLVNKRNCIYYNPRDLNSLRNKILYYKDNPDICRKIRDNAIKLIFKKHTFDVRVKDMFKILKKKKVI